MVQKALLTSWPLFFGLAMIMVGNGLQGTLLGVRASVEGFDTTVIGLIMSLYYLGFLIGSYTVPKLVAGVGHIRVFAALASLASTTVLLNGLFPNEWLWAAMRIATGFSYAGLFIVVESWLNGMSTNEMRGKILSLYMITTYVGMVAGQFLLNLADPEEMELFVLTSILVSLALLPISLSTRPAPVLEDPEHLSLRRLYVISPLGLIGSLGAGLGAGTVFGIGAVYATSIGLNYAQVANFMASFITGGILAQMPIGWLSDHYDRRKILIGVAFLAAMASLACLLFGGASTIVLYLIMAVFGGLSLSVYALCLAHTNDHLTNRQIVAAGSSLILVNGIGASIGPIAVSFSMDMFGPSSFFVFMSVVFSGIFVFGIIRTQMRDAVPLDEQGSYVAVTSRSTPVAMQMADEEYASTDTEAENTIPAEEITEI